MAYIEELKDVIRKLHGVESKHVTRHSEEERNRPARSPGCFAHNRCPSSHHARVEGDESQCRH